MNQTPAFGGIPSVDDYRDHIAAAAAVPVVANFSIPINLPPIYLGGVMYQRQEPDCVLFATVKLMKLHLYITTGKWVDLSPRFLAILIKRYDGQDRATGGTYPRLAMKLAMQYGCCTTALLPNDTKLSVLEYRNDALLTDAMFAEALQYRIPGFTAIPVDFQQTREKLNLHKAISTLFMIGEELWTPGWGKNDIDPMRTPAHVVSGHQMVQNGYPDNTFNHVENQWSPLWADQGANKFDYRAWMPFIVEQWAVARIPQDVANFLKTLPAPDQFHFRFDSDMKQGDSNQDVKWLQVALMILGYLAPVAPAELGIFGPKTAAAVAKYQAQQGISPLAPANAGRKTRAALNARFAA